MHQFSLIWVDSYIESYIGCLLAIITTSSLVIFKYRHVKIGRAGPIQKPNVGRVLTHAWAQSWRGHIAFSGSALIRQPQPFFFKFKKIHIQKFKKKEK